MQPGAAVRAIILVVRRRGTAVHEIAYIHYANTRRGPLRDHPPVRFGENHVVEDLRPVQQPVDAAQPDHRFNRQPVLLQLQADWFALGIHHFEHGGPFARLARYAASDGTQQRDVGPDVVAQVGGRFPGAVHMRRRVFQNAVEIVHHLRELLGNQRKQAEFAVAE